MIKEYLFSDSEKKPQLPLNSKDEGIPSTVSDMVDFLCSPHRIGRYRERSQETDVEYLRWLLGRRGGRPLDS